MTTEELVAQAIVYVRNTTSGDVLPDHMRQIDSFRDGGNYIDRFSVALNDETRDVRYVERKVFYTPAIPSTPETRVVEVFEVTPVTVVQTEYRRV